MDTSNFINIGSMASKKSTVLYVDDEIHNLSTFNAAFRRHYRVLTALSARDAIELLHNNSVDLIITDQRMPEMTGVQFLEAVIPEYPGPARMILTGFSDIDAIIKAINTGTVLRYITKPWNEAELKQIIDMGIKIHELERNSQVLMENLENALSYQKKAIEQFEKYAPDKSFITQALYLDDKSASYQGEYRIISTLFSDIRHFTNLSETMDPKSLVNYLNAYFSIMVDCVIKNHGSIYRLVGDGLWAIFGWPVSSIYNQRNAVFCAIDMFEALGNFNQTFGEKIDYKTTIGIGISTGEAVVGRIQTENFTSSLVVGEDVDAALEIEDLTRDMVNTILIGESTWQAVKSDVEVEPMEVRVREGKNQQLYKVLGKKQT